MDTKRADFILTPIQKFMENLSKDKKMYILGFMQGVQAERESDSTVHHTKSTQPTPTG